MAEYGTVPELMSGTKSMTDTDALNVGFRWKHCIGAVVKGLDDEVGKCIRRLWARATKWIDAPL